MNETNGYNYKFWQIYYQWILNANKILAGLEEVEITSQELFNLSDKASGKYDIITANIVANAIMSLAPAVPGLMADNGVFIASGIIDSRKDEVLAALKAAGLAVQEVKEKRGWECIICKK